MGRRKKEPKSVHREISLPFFHSAMNSKFDSCFCSNLYPGFEGHQSAFVYAGNLVLYSHFSLCVIDKYLFDLLFIVDSFPLYQKKDFTRETLCTINTCKP